MTKDEALKMAIEALLTGNQYADAINACKEALEQPAATPVAYMNELGFAETKEGLVPNFGRVVPLYTRPSKDDPQDWNEDRLDTIVQNGNEGLHYDDIS